MGNILLNLIWVSLYLDQLLSLHLVCWGVQWKENAGSGITFISVMGIVY